MTPQEQQMIDQLVERIRSTPVAAKDLAAEARLQQGLAGYPDAIYVLAQTVLVQQYGLQQAQARIADLQAQVDALQQQRAAPPASGGSFLSHLFGGAGAPAQAPSQPQAPPYQPVTNTGYAPGGMPYGGQPMYSQPMYPAPMYAQPMGGGFLQGALQTAAGVAAGEMAFAGMESLFHGFGGGGFGGGYGGGRPEEIVNNYYEEGDRHEHHEEYRDAGSFGQEERLHDADYVTRDSDLSDGGNDLSSDDVSSDDTGYDGSGDDGSNAF